MERKKTIGGRGRNNWERGRKNGERGGKMGDLGEGGKKRDLGEGGKKKKLKGRTMERIKKNKLEQIGRRGRTNGGETKKMWVERKGNLGGEEDQIGRKKH